MTLEAADPKSLLLISCFILCKPQVHKEDGVDLIRISIIKPFGLELLIRVASKTVGLPEQELLKIDACWSF